MSPSVTNRHEVVAMGGTTLTTNWAASDYLPTVLAPPVATLIGISSMLVFAAFSAELIVSTLTGPFEIRAGRQMLRAW